MDKITEQHYQKILNACTKPFVSNSKELLQRPAQSVLNRIEDLQKVFGTSEYFASKALTEYPNIINFPLEEIAKRIQLARRTLWIDYRTSQLLMIQNIQFCEKSLPELEKILKNYKKVFQFSYNDLADILTKNNLVMQTNEQLWEKIKLIRSFSETQYQATGLCRYCSILNLSLDDIKSNQEFAQKLNLGNSPLEYYSIFDCTYEENLKKYEMLKQVGLENNVMFASHITSEELTKRIDWFKQTKYKNPKIILHNFWFCHYYTRSTEHKKSMESSPKEYAKRSTLSFPEKPFPKREKQTYFPYRIGKRKRLGKKDRFEAKVLCNHFKAQHHPFDKHFDFYEYRKQMQYRPVKLKLTPTEYNEYIEINYNTRQIKQKKADKKTQPKK